MMIDIWKWDLNVIIIHKMYFCLPSQPCCDDVNVVWWRQLRRVTWWTRHDELDPEESDEEDDFGVDDETDDEEDIGDMFIYLTL